MAALAPAQIVQALAPIVGRVGAAGIAGNLMQESSDNPASAGGGLAQWQGARYTGLVKYAQSRGLSPTSDQAALGYLAQDLKGPYSGLAAQLRSAKDPGTAATLFSNIYERPGVPMLGNRINYARQALGATGSQAPVSLGAPPQAGMTSQTVPTFDQAGFNAANAKFIAGRAVQEAGSSANPFNFGPKGAGLGPSPLFAKGLLTTSAPNPADYQGTKTVQTATHALQQLAGTGLTNVHAGAQGYVNPIPGAVVGRTDMGVDANLKPGAPIRAIGDSKVLGIMPGWYAGQPYLALQLTSGPKAGQNWYVAEQINPLVKPGQTVKAGQPVATYAPSGTGIEIGWAGKNWQQTLAQESGNTGDSSHGNAPAGVNFRAFLGGLGG